MIPGLKYIIVSQFPEMHQCLAVLDNAEIHVWTLSSAPTTTLIRRSKSPWKKRPALFTGAAEAYGLPKTFGRYPFSYP